MNPFSLLIKPVSADCNLRCSYCFYIDHLSKVEKMPRMSDKVLETMISSYMQTNQNNNFNFGWQGGEPTLLGLEFWEKVIILQKKYASKGAVISNGLQTNGTLITDSLAKFFGEYKFLLGVSLDGPPYLHDYYRKTIGETPTHNLVMRGIDILRRYKVEFNILILVNNVNVKKASEVYNYLKDKEFKYHQYIPCVEYDKFGNPQAFSINGDEWGAFLCDIFDQWKKEDINRISIRLFDSILEYLVYGKYNVCYMGSNCCQYFVVEYNGNIYPCDFYVRDDLLLGNVLENKWEEILNSPIYLQFGQRKSSWNENCKKCSYLNLCHGDCQKFRLGNQQNSHLLSILCEGWKKFYTYALPQLKIIAKNIKNGKKVISSTQIKPKKIGRNILCPCGSGKKYKDCCLR
ncbi:MAG: anaerobic sulfatase maturase [Candidatus Lokiarchaeia archaeon]|nr:anaerobic sulfatase maturase [Candidatus Lokiarchaeia archaeon]